jgi:uncharacterized paraquat-inducible protein A
MSDISKIWKEKKKIFEGLKNYVFIDEFVEQIHNERMEICNSCEFIDRTGSSCVVPGTQPCCNRCGCSLKLKGRSLSSSCDEGKWSAIITQEEQEELDRNRDETNI